MDHAFSLIESFFMAIAAEAIGLHFIVGALIFLLGLAAVGLFALTRMLGYRTTGTVIGAIEHTRIKQRKRDGETVEEEKRSLYPVYEYIAADGRPRQMRGSEGGTMVHAYKTGQSVNLIVREDDGYDDVYDADERGFLYIGFGMLAVGITIMAWVGSMATALGVTVLTCLVAGVIKVVAGVLTKKREPQRQTSKRQPYSKSFDPADLKPIESFAR